MALSSSARSRSGAGVTRRRVKPPMPEGTGAAGLEKGEVMGNGAEGCGPVSAEGGGATGLTHEAASSNGASTTTSAMALAQTGARAGATAGVPSCLRRWLARARALGLTPQELVFELHVRQGLPLLAVAQVLELGLEAVRGLWAQSRAARAALAPQSEMDFTSIREHIGAALWQTVEATFPDVMAMAETEADEGADAGPPAAPSPPMLSVRLKALDQIAKLYDITLEQPAAAFSPLPYATPEDIAEDVRQRVLEMHLRDEG